MSSFSAILALDSLPPPLGTLGQFKGLKSALAHVAAAGAIAFASCAIAPASALAQNATNPQDCQPGGYWYMQTPGESVVMACPGFASAVGASAGASFEAAPSPAMDSTATNPEDCQPGGYWYIPTEEYPWSSVPMVCK